MNRAGDYDRVMAMRKKAIITGISGQDGTYLAKFLIKKKYDVVGIGTNFPNEEFLKNLGIKIRKIDICDTKKITKLMNEFLPNEFYNLAGKSSVAQSWNYKESLMEVNALSVERILNAIKNIETDKDHRIKFYQASSSEIFDQLDGKYKNENSKIGPVSPYGASKAYSHLITNVYRDAYKMYAVSGILFNHESPLRSEAYLTKKISSGIARIKNNKSDRITVGNLKISRDWGYAGDYVEAIWAMMQLGKAQNFVIASGKSYSVEELLEYVFTLAKIKNWQSFVTIDKALFRPSEPNLLVGDPTRANKILNWKAKKSIFEVLKTMYFEDLKNPRYRD
jgi:GDPmannose 4,6-dehydratase